jgi:uncharacterized ubiquitin-like protein YukD
MQKTEEEIKDAVQFLEYNAERSHLRIPEYGRHLQKLIDQATKIESKEERNKAAHYIIKVMGTLNPHLRDVPDFQHKLWDQIFIMSDFNLDVDSPFPIPTRDVINLRPDVLPYPQQNPKYRFYGNNIKYMIDIANSWNDGEMKDGLIMVIANHMKKSFLSWNKDTVEDIVIFQHLLELSGGKINLINKDEELLTSQSLIRINQKSSNKSNTGQPKMMSNKKKSIKPRKFITKSKNQ